MANAEQINGWKSGCCGEIADNMEYFDIRNVMIWRCNHCKELYETEEEAKECCNEVSSHSSPK